MPIIEIGKALRNYRERLKITLAEMAAMLKVSTTTIVNYETGKRTPDIDFLIAFAEATGEDFIYWLGLRVAESKSAGAAAVKEMLDAVYVAHGTSAAQSEKPFVSLPLYDIKDAANVASVSGQGRVTDEMLQFSTAWIKRELNSAPSDLFLILVDDESMVPTLRPGDTILLDRRATWPDREGIYILRMNGVSLVKRLQILPGGIIKVVSDNPAYETFTIRLSDINEQDFAILGRVVWVVWAGRRI
ncbi:MAG: LexA family transcriptional regulator [Gallionella sp.]|nr:LexA family transcriptional regulator [Gallionella sp.]